MTATAKILNAKSVVVDGRLENVRTRHVQLKALHDTVQARSDDILAALTRQYPKLREGAATSAEVLNVSMAATLRAMRLLAAELDQAKDVQHKNQLRKNKKATLSHTRQVPSGLVGIVAVGATAKPVDALLGPLAGAIAAGCPAVLFVERGPLVSLLEEIFRSALDRDAYVVSELDSSDYLNFCDEVVDLRPGEVQYEDVVVVDKSLVDERLYRDVKYQKQAPPARMLANLESIAQAIAEALAMSTRASSTVHRILVSDEIASTFKSLLPASQKGLVSSYKSTEHLMSELQRRPTGKAYLFANEAHGAYLASYADCLLPTINCIPLDLLVTNLPSGGSIRFIESLKKDDGFVLEPVWSIDLFSKSKSIIAQPVSALKSKKIQKKQINSTALQPMKRGKADHMEFFPTGFKITAFPTALMILGGVGFVSFQGVKHLYLFGRTFF